MYSLRSGFPSEAISFSRERWGTGLQKYCYFCVPVLKIFGFSNRIFVFVIVVAVGSLIIAHHRCSWDLDAYLVPCIDVTSRRKAGRKFYESPVRKNVLFCAEDWRTTGKMNITIKDDGADFLISGAWNLFSFDKNKITKHRETVPSVPQGPPNFILLKTND